MRATLLALVVFAIGCGVESEPTDKSGDWSYGWALSAPEPTLYGTMTLEQTGDRLQGRIGLPDSYPAGQTWDMVVSGTETELQIDVSGVPSWTLRCISRENSISCDGTRMVDGVGSTFIATR